VQLPAWNEALGLPRPWDQQWSLRLQQIVAYETDLLEYEDLFDGNPAVEAKVEALKQAARAELQRIADLGGAIPAVESGYLKQALVESNTQRVRGIETGAITVVGVNKFTESAPSPLVAGEGGAIMMVDPAAEAEQIERLQAWRRQRDQAAVDAALADLRAAAKDGRNIMEPSIRAAKAGVTTGEWAATLRGVFGEYRAPTGVAAASNALADDGMDELRDEVAAVAKRLGRPLKLLVGKPGLDGHSNGAEQIAVKARDCGMEVVYEGIRLTPEQIVAAALEEGVHLVGLSILSGSHVELATEVIERMRKEGIGEVPVVVGGIIPPEDAARLKAAGIAGVFTPKDYDLTQIMREIARLVDNGHSKAA
jgi:(2R)-ethylmalonyl-CoA mutase